MDAATLGLLDRVKEAVESAEPPGRDAVTRAFWGACHGGQLAAADYLLTRGADLDWVGYDNKTPLDIARTTDADGVVQWLREHGAKGRAELP
jgi:hypothetical protein